jgi:Zn finger protein HypA/HybF involved in hydrogenase expression
MDSAHQALKAALEVNRDTASNALTQFEPSQEERAVRWTCKACRYVKHFTKPATLEATGRCPRCKCTEFRPFSDTALNASKGGGGAANRR